MKWNEETESAFFKELHKLERMNPAERVFCAIELL